MLTNEELLSKIKMELKIDFYGDHGIGHWKRVYTNTQVLANHYNIQSDVFELFAVLHDSKRENEFSDKYHGKRAAAYVQQLYDDGDIQLSLEDLHRLKFACSNHTFTDKKDSLYQDLVVQICLDSDRMDLGRVGIKVNPRYLVTAYAIKEYKTLSCSI